MGKKAIITGGAKGIGSAVSRVLATQGWNLCLVARDENALNLQKKTLESEFKIEVKTLALDLTKPESVDQVFETCPEANALICNAGNYGKLGMLDKVSFQEWKSSFDLNFFSIAQIAQVFIQKNLTNAGRKKIVFMCGAGVGSGKVWGAMSAYSISKMALYRLTEVLHSEYGEKGFDVNAIAPGAVDTSFVDQAMQVGKEALGDTFDMIQKIRSSGGESPVLAGEMIARLLDPACDGVSGRLLSAKWDRDAVQSGVDQIKKDPDLFRLRRIDGTLFERAKNV